MSEAKVTTKPTGAGDVAGKEIRIGDDERWVGTVLERFVPGCIAAIERELNPPAATSAPSATGATSEFVSVPKEPTLEMWDAAWKSIGLPYRAKLSLHEIKTLFEKFHAAMLAAAPVDSQGTAPRVEETAIRDAALEEAAKVCESEYHELNSPRDDWQRGVNTAAYFSAQKIRELKGRDMKGGE